MYQVKFGFLFCLVIGCTNPATNSNEQVIGPFGPQWVCRTSKDSGFLLRMETDGKKALIHGALTIGKKGPELDPTFDPMVFPLEASYSPETLNLSKLEHLEFVTLDQAAAIKLEQVPPNKGDLTSGVGRGAWKMSFSSADQASVINENSKFSVFAFKIFELFKIGNHEGFYGSPNRDFYILCDRLLP
jgi:hypothetical protein